MNFNFEILIYIVVSMSLIFLSIFFILGFFKIIRNLNDLSNLKKFKEVENWLNQYVFSTAESRVIKPCERDSVSRFAKNLKGDYLFKLQNLYLFNKLHLLDLKELHSKKLSVKFLALKRIHQLQIKLEEEEDYLELMQENDIRFSVLVLKQYISHYQKKSFLTFTRFISERKDLSKGMLYNLTKDYAEIDNEGISFLIDRIKDDNILQVLIEGAYYNPPQNLRDIVFNNVYLGSPVELKLSALRTLCYFPDEKTKRLMSELLFDENWIIRLFLAKLFYAYKFNSIKKYLEIYSSDFNYYVRRETAKVLIEMLPHSASMIENILQNKNHLSYDIIKHDISKGNHSISKVTE